MSRSIKALYADCEASLSSIDVTVLDGLRDSQIVLVGASGFIGTWITLLVAYLNETHGFRTRIRGYARRPERWLAEVGDLAKRHPEISFHSADVRSLAGAPTDAHWIINASGSPDSRRHASEPVETLAIFGEGAARLMELAERSVDLKKFLQFSSGLVGMAGPADSRLDASQTYVNAKRFGEAVCAAHFTQRRLPVVVTRPFTFIGPFQALDAPWAVNNFLMCAARGQPLKVLGDGESRRTFLYGSDAAVQALLQMVRGEPGTVHNLAGPQSTSLADLARRVAAMAPRPLEVRFNTGRGNIPSNDFVPEPDESADDFGFSPAFSLERALERTLSWHNSGEAVSPR
ncbi:MAG: NAD(P)-dependent oxidoreductase [Alphaproteobacteria bacterium]|nr:NAD(P)-dependent oxidoreductase [Alphaproteobacteria bacterium]MBU2270012.1 NAD(P)-dependent oxidoreductase [Alphaproteobacteria bacterium]MBU2417855.1 NAD(P)-dependent oxidoreductase [Alphaproteobacteria bacterium]